VTYQPNVYREQGGDKMIVANGGELELQSGATLDVQAGCSFDCNGTFKLHGLEIPSGFANVYYVDGQNGDDDNDGLTMATAKKTYAAARTLSNATIDWGATPKRYNAIFVAPGVYTEVCLPPYYCWVFGMGILGTDTAAEFHPAAGSAITNPDLSGSTMLGTALVNLRFECETAVPVCNFGIFNNSILAGCEIVRGIAGLATMGAEFDNVTHAQIIGNRFISGVADHPIGLSFNGGADKFLHASRIEGNHIFASSKGITIAANCTASGTIIKDNVIVRPTKGIEDLSGLTFCINNWISALTDAIEHANSATRCIGNHVINNATGAVEASGTD